MDRDRDRASPPHPHEIVIDLGATQIVRGFRYLPRAVSANGTIGQYEFYVSTDPNAFGEPAARGAFSNPVREHEVTFTPRPGRYTRMRARSCQAGTPYTSCAELNVLPAE